MNTQHYNPNLRLSPHFRLGEFTRSITAERLGISNEPGLIPICACRHTSGWASSPEASPPSASASVTNLATSSCWP